VKGKGDSPVSRSVSGSEFGVWHFAQTQSVKKKRENWLSASFATTAKGDFGRTFAILLQFLHS